MLLLFLELPLNLFILHQMVILPVVVEEDKLVRDALHQKQVELVEQVVVDEVEELVHLFLLLVLVLVGQQIVVVAVAVVPILDLKHQVELAEKEL